ncbi:MAG: tripartite tricarboxylate transporter permease [Spirochaetales bacterium]|nr:tripartite tricarboxylate transporter permease [Spirochaetales bacterium]
MQEILAGFYHLFAPLPMFYVIIGVTLGIIVGAIPGLTGSMLIALTLPLTFYMNSLHAMDLLVSMYVGSISGGLITAILLRIPGTPSSIVTTFDGYPMAQQGKAGRALMLGIVSSFIGGLVSWFILILAAPPLSRFALKFGPFEIFSLVLSALVLIAGLGGEGSFFRSLLAGFLGILIACPGLDPVTSTPRLTFGMSEMIGGFGLLPVLIGMFGISQIISDITNIEAKAEKIPFTFRGLFLSFTDLKNNMGNFLRSSLIGTWVGFLPGIGGNIGSIIAYSAAKNSSKNPEKFGTGCDEGIVASETANNATIGGAFIPFLTLGIPGSIITAILMGALILHDITPGPLLFKEDPELVYGIMAVVFTANVIMFIIMLFACYGMAKLVDVPKSLMIPAILVFCVIGTFALNNRFFDVWVMFGFGLFGFVLEKLKVPLGPLIIGLVLSPFAEVNLRSGLMSSGGSLLPLVTRPISLFFVILSALTLVWTMHRSFIAPYLARRRKEAL